LSFGVPNFFTKTGIWSGNLKLKWEHGTEAGTGIFDDANGNNF
jgi:hypothetical protein